MCEIQTHSFFIASIGVTFSLTHSLTHSLIKVEKQHDIAEIEQYFENKSYRSTLGDSKTVFEPYPYPKNSPFGPQKVKIAPKIKSKSKFRIEGTIENKMCSTI